MQIHGFNKTTLLDFPKHLAATIFTGGCNFRCPFCHNASLVLYTAKQPLIPEDEVLSILSKRKNILEGVCITGGEPTLQKDLPIFIRKIKELGLKVKLDTNGYHPDVIHYLIDHSLIDYIAMDIKNSKQHYMVSIGTSMFDHSLLDESVQLIMNSNIDYEFRTTVVREHHTQEDFISIGQWIKGANSYYLQSYQDSGDVILPGFSSYTKDELNAFLSILKPYINNVSIRGLD